MTVLTHRRVLFVLRICRKKNKYVADLKVPPGGLLRELSWHCVLSCVALCIYILIYTTEKLQLLTSATKQLIKTVADL